MYKGLFKTRIVYLISAIVIVLSMTGSVLAIDHWWHGGISANVNDPANWTDRNTSTEPTTPTGYPRDIVRIGGSWDSEDLNGNGVLDAGEDLNGNGVIDDPDPNSGVGWGGYYGAAGGGIDVPVDPVLSDTYVSRTGTAEGGWWFVLNAPNILTLKDGAFLIMDQENCNLRNGGRLEVQGRSSTNGPSLITARRFRIAENGSIGEAAGETCQLRINGTGWVQMDYTLDGNGEAFMIGTSEPPGTMPRGEIIIEEQGRLELLSADPAPYLDFGNPNPLVNQIIIRDKGELWLPGDPATMGRVGPDNTVTSLQEMIDMGLITSDHGILTMSGANPTVVKVAKLRITNPSPADGQTNVATQVVLSWNPGTLAASHDVYFGTDPDSVNDANRANPLGVLKNRDQVETYYPPTGTLDLDFGKTYYWRIDEVNNLSDQPIYKGDLWSFTVEPFAFLLLAESISVTASSQVQGQGPENTINGSGLVDDLHSTVMTDMWATVEGEALPAWIQYEFDKTYKLHEMLVWNYNGQFLLSAVGLKDVVVEYSIDGANWTQINNVSEFARASGTDGYASNTTVAFGDVPIRYVKITANSNWGGGFVNQYGLSEVRFLYIPVSARMPVPDDGAADVAIDTSLSWRSGRGATEHNIYLSTDSQLVADGTIPDVTVQDAIYGPLSLNLGKTYYWRVDEVNNANTVPVWEGGTWSFTTRDYLVVDDFESYNDIPEGQEGSNLVYSTWRDGGYGESNDPTNGSIMGYFEAFQPSMETTIVHGGRQSAPLMYDNRTASVSEVTASTSDLAVGSDWTIGTPATLSLWFYGDTDNPATDRMYVKVNGVKRRYDGDLAQAQWQEFSVDLASLGINLNTVSTIAVVFERIGATGGSGIVFIDDIRLYAPLNN